MRFVLSPEEIARVQQPLRAPRFINGQSLSVDFLTEAETIRRLLPPGFSPVEHPVVTAYVARWQSTCVGDFCGGAVQIPARWGELRGAYVLAMYMTTDPATLYGRDLFGEPKKIAHADLYRRGGNFNGYVERAGVRLIDLTVETDTDHGPGDVTDANFNIKARPAADGDGLQEDAIVTHATFRTSLRVNLEGSGSVRLAGTPHDPLDELEVGSVLRAGYVEGDLDATVRAVGTIAADDFLPYFYGRNGYDWPALDTEGATSLV
jgi:acetoacetate decarboxylase